MVKGGHAINPRRPLELGDFLPNFRGFQLYSSRGLRRNRCYPMNFFKKPLWKHVPLWMKSCLSWKFRQKSVRGVTKCLINLRIFPPFLFTAALGGLWKHTWNEDPNELSFGMGRVYWKGIGWFCILVDGGQTRYRKITEEPPPHSGRTASPISIGGWVHGCLAGSVRSLRS